MAEKKAFTLVEVLIAASIFTIVSLIAIIVFVNVIRIQRRVALENAIYEDARVMMERIAREVRENTVDYEEYYNKAMPQEVAFNGLNTDNLNNKNPYGNRYGCYAQRFYNPGSDHNSSDGGFGAICSAPSSVAGQDAAKNPGCLIDKTTLDINTGQNPFAGFSGGDATTATAFCDKAQGGTGDCTAAAPTNFNEQDELYLVNALGTQKTLLALKQMTPGSPEKSEHALALLRLTGEDQNNDGIVETWGSPLAAGNVCTEDPTNPLCCSKGFSCPTATVPTLESSLEYNASNPYLGFVPISPTRTNVVSLKFFVAPLEDPRKAFAEIASDMQQQPHVTVVLTVRPSAAALSGYDGDIPTITLQTTVTSRVFNEVKSYYTKAGGVCASYSMY